MIEDHGFTVIDNSGLIEVNGLVMSNFESQDDGLLSHLDWLIACVENKKRQIKAKLSNNNACPTA